MTTSILCCELPGAGRCTSISTYAHIQLLTRQGLSKTVTGSILAEGSTGQPPFLAASLRLSQMDAVA
eukprot:scaffold322133_cov22-Tisochrysis_lutea.AAC.1